VTVDAVLERVQLAHDRYLASSRGEA
jgi:hypothetical protein